MNNVSLNQNEKIKLSIRDLKLEQFRNKNQDKNPLLFFKILNLNHEFLKADSALWEGLDSYKKARDSSLFIVSTKDIAERGVKIAEDYNRVLTKDYLQYEILS